MKKRTHKLLLNRETLRQLNSELGLVRGWGGDAENGIERKQSVTCTCANSGCPEICETMHGAPCLPAPTPSPSPAPTPNPSPEPTPSPSPKLEDEPNDAS